jgi:ABC-2 type transport system ATP-binding protein
MLVLIDEMPERRGCSIVVSTHLLPDVDRLCDSVVIMHQGTIRFSGKIEELRATGATGRGYVVEVKEHADQLAAALDKRGATAKQKSPVALMVELAAGMTPRDVLGVAREAGLQVRGIEVEQESMEQAFLRVIGAEPPVKEVSR